MEFLHDPAAFRSGAIIFQRAEMFEHGHAIDLSFSDAPYETYEHSKDLYGDGSIVIVTKSLVVLYQFCTAEPGEVEF
jgi:hypothetical protein